MKITDVTEDRIFKTFGRTYEKSQERTSKTPTEIGTFDFSTVKNW